MRVAAHDLESYRPHHDHVRPVAVTARESQILYTSLGSSPLQPPGSSPKFSPPRPPIPLRISLRESSVQTELSDEELRKHCAELQDDCDAIRTQLNSVVESHRQLLQEYQRCSSTLALREREISQLSAENEMLKSSRAEPAAVQQSNAEQLVQHRNDRSSGDSSQRVKTVDHHYDELAAEMHRLSVDMLQARERDSERARSQAEEFAKLTKEALAASEASIRKLADELASTRQNISSATAQERQALESKLRATQEALEQHKSSHEKTMLRSDAEVNHLKECIGKLEQEKDELMSEAKFQMEIVADLKAEKAALGSEIGVLRGALAGTPYDPQRHAPSDSVSLLRPSIVNVSHNIEAPQATATASDVPRIQSSEQSRSPAPPPTTAAVEGVGPSQQDSNLLARISALEDELEDTNSKHQASSFEAAEARKQLERIKETLKLRDVDLEDANETMSDMARVLESEREQTSSARAEISKLEETLKKHKEESRERIESLNQQIADLTDQNAALREKSDATDIAIQDREQAFADLLATLQVKQTAAANVDTKPLELPPSVAQDRPVAPPAAAAAQLVSSQAAVPQAEGADTMNAEEKKELLSDFQKNDRAMKLLSGVQRARAKKKGPA